MESNDARYRRFIEGMDQLPALPVIVSRLIAVMNSPETSAQDAADLIEKDPGLTGKILRLANSAFYGMPRSVSSVQSAVVILGFNTLKSLTLGATVMNLFPHEHEKAVFNRLRFWKHSIVCAMAARSIALCIFHAKPIDPQSAFCAGIMHDIGKLVFELFTPREYAVICGVAQKKPAPLATVETAALYLNHADVGRILADKWALPLDLEHCIVYHHDPQSAQTMTELVAIVQLADAMAHETGCGLWDNEPAPPMWDGAKQCIGITDARYTQLVETLNEETGKSEEFLSIIAE
jgi:HD-like signal output (HDOD) protein